MPVLKLELVVLVTLALTATLRLLPGFRPGQESAPDARHPTFHERQCGCAFCE